MGSHEVLTGSVSYTLETPDMDFWPIEVSIARAQNSDEDIEVVWADGCTSIYYPFWLREQCSCTDCHSETTREALIDITKIPLEIQAESITLDEQGYVNICWSDGGHKSRYHPGWLRANSYDDWAQKERVSELKTWDNSFSVLEFDGVRLLECDDHLYEWLTALDSSGLTLLKNVPTTKGSIRKIAERIGIIRQSNFGTLFDVVSKPDADSNAYLSIGLPLHMDLPSRETPPGLQFLHCIVNEAKGGASQFVDGFHLAKIIKQEAPEIFKIVTTVDYSFQNRSVDCDFRASGPLIRLDKYGNPIESRINTFIAAPIINLPHDMLKKAIAAKHYLLQTMNEPRFKVEFKMQPGDMVAFDNRRILHGRSEFYPNTGSRFLEGCYLDRDDLGSALRMLERKKRRIKSGY